MFFQTIINALPLTLSLGIIFGIMAIGVFITFRILDFADLTVDGSFATGGAVFAVLYASQVNIILCLIVAFLAGAAAGLITALIHCYLGIPGILAGILTQLMLWSISISLMGSSALGINSRLELINSTSISTALPILIGIAAILIGFLYWLFGTKYGASIRAAGSNADMSRANGINVNSRKIVALMLSNGLVAFAGSLYTVFNGSADMNNGRGAIVIGLAAIIIGGAIVRKWGKNFAIQLTFVVVGSFIYQLIYNIVFTLLNGKGSEWLKMFSALIVILFLAIPYIKSHYFVGKKFHKVKQSGKESK